MTKLLKINHYDYTEDGHYDTLPENHQKVWRHEKFVEIKIKIQINEIQIYCHAQTKI